MLRVFGASVWGVILLGAVSIANAQAPQVVPGKVVSGPIDYSDLESQGILVDGGYPGRKVVPVIGSHHSCYTLYPLSAISPYTYTGSPANYYANGTVPYPYAPIGFGWYGEFWRGW